MQPFSICMLPHSAKPDCRCDKLTCLQYSYDAGLDILVMLHWSTWFVIFTARVCRQHSQTGSAGPYHQRAPNAHSFCFCCSSRALPLRLFTWQDFNHQNTSANNVTGQLELLYFLNILCVYILHSTSAGMKHVMELRHVFL